MPEVIMSFPFDVSSGVDRGFSKNMHVCVDDYGAAVLFLSPHTVYPPESFPNCLSPTVTFTQMYPI